MTQQRNHRIHSGHGTNTGRITHEDRKRGRFYTRRRWQQAAAALVFILAALFLYRTGQLYLERKALSREAQQKRTGEWNIRGRATGAIHI